MIYYDFIIYMASCTNVQSSPLTDIVGRSHEVCALLGLYSMFTGLNSPRWQSLYGFVWLPVVLIIFRAIMRRVSENLGQCFAVFYANHLHFYYQLGA